MLIPDRLPSLLLLVGAWVPPAAAGWGAAKLTVRARPVIVYCALAAFNLLWAWAWYHFQLGRIPPYVPGATADPTYAPPEAVRALRLIAAAVVLPLSAIAGVAAYRIGTRITRTSPGRPGS